MVGLARASCWLIFGGPVMGCAVHSEIVVGLIKLCDMWTEGGRENPLIVEDTGQEVQPICHKIFVTPAPSWTCLLIFLFNAFVHSESKARRERDLCWGEG